MLPPSRSDRPNLRQARLIDLALQVQRTAGTRAAAAMLAACDTDFRLAVRVLAEPYQRRGCLKRAVACRQ
jgi:hypothetical protein